MEAVRHQGGGVGDVPHHELHQHEGPGHGQHGEELTRGTTPTAGLQSHPSLSIGIPGVSLARHRPEQ